MALREDVISTCTDNGTFQVDHRTSIPVTAVGITTTISALLALIGIGSSLAFNDIISISVVGLYASYLVAAILLLWRRVTGAIRPASESYNESAIVNAPNSTLTWGPFKMPPIIGALVNCVAVAYMIIIFLFAFWPPALPVGPSTMNYAEKRERTEGNPTSWFSMAIKIGVSCLAPHYPES